MDLCLLPMEAVFPERFRQALEAASAFLPAGLAVHLCLEARKAQVVLPAEFPEGHNILRVPRACRARLGREPAASLRIRAACPREDTARSVGAGKS